MNKRWLIVSWIGALATLSIMVPAVQAQSVLSISADSAQGRVGSRSPVIHLWPGYGTNLSFLPTQEHIVQVWIDDPSRVALAFDQPLCPASTESDCVAGRPSVIHLRRIQGPAWAYLPRASGTLLTVMTETAGGERHLYTFQIEFDSGEPAYHTVALQPASPIDPILGPSDVRRGLQIAESWQMIRPGQDLWQRLHRFLTLTRNGIPVPTAAQQAGVSVAVITRLADWGAQARDDSPPSSPAR
ncbi:MAG: hypothetical protein ACTS2F_19355 [Thainema sp.]